MKRLTLLTILLVVVGLTAGALEVKPAFTLSGWAKVEWGIDLVTGATGFNNTSDADLTVTLIAADSTDTHAGTGAWYGSITIADIEVWLGGDDAATLVGTVAWLTDADVTAKIVGLGGALAIGVFAAPDLGSNVDFVAAIENDDGTDDDAFIDNELPTDVDQSFAGLGTYVSYNVTKDIMVGFEIVSNNAWTVADPDAYAMALDVSAVFAPVTVKAGVDYAFAPFAGAGPVGLGVKVSADTAMLDPWVGFDASIGTVFAFDVGAGVTATFMETVTAALSLVYGDGFNGLDVKFVLTEPAAKGLVDNLDLTFTAYVFDIAGTLPMEMQFILDGGYLMGKLYPNFTFTVTDAGNPVDTALTVKVMLGVDATMIPLTTLGLYWTSGDVLTSGWGALVASAKVTY